MQSSTAGIVGNNTQANVTQTMFNLKKYKKLYFPGLLLLLIVLSIIINGLEKASFDIAIVPMVIGGGFIIWNTIITVIKLKKITAGIMVVLALIGTGYVGEYLAGAIVAFMMIFGEFMEDVTLNRTRNAVRELIKLVPEIARKKIDGEYKEVSIKNVRVGDYLLVKPGERIPVDGVILSGQAAINESSITGESMPVDKTENDKVFVSTLNENGVIEIQAEKIGSETTLGKIIKVVRQAQENKGSTQKTADKFATYFTPAILLICGIVWFTTNDLLRVMTVLVIACPCALVLATPTAVVASVGNAARKGGLIKGGITLEKVAKITILCVDKTGTITEGKPKLVDLTTFGEYSKDEVLRLAAIVEKNSQHPLAKAVLNYAADNGINSIPDSDNFEMLFGRGIKVRFEGEVIEVSNAKALEQYNLEVSHEVSDYLYGQEKLGRTAMVLIKSGKIIGGLAIADTIRKNIPQVIVLAKQSGVQRIIMLTGDNAATAKAISEQAGISEYYANLLPEDKLNMIKKLQSEGEVVAMVGDGVNDAPALTLADVGIAMGAIGTDVAIESSDIALMADDMAMLPEILGLSRRALRVIKQNIWGFAVFVNIAGIYLSGVGFLTPIAAAVVHNCASVLVVANSARLLNYNYYKNEIKHK